jgi:hypothetical protein
MNQELKIIDLRPTYHVPRTYVPGTFVTMVVALNNSDEKVADPKYLN